jgi:hypothetical protein
LRESGIQGNGRAQMIKSLILPARESQRFTEIAVEARRIGADGHTTAKQRHRLFNTSLLQDEDTKSFQRPKGVRRRPKNLTVKNLSLAEPPLEVQRLSLFDRLNVHDVSLKPHAGT